MTLPVSGLLASALVSLNLSDAEKLRVTERSDLERKLKGLGQKHARVNSGAWPGAMTALSSDQSAFQHPTNRGQTGSGEAPLRQSALAPRSFPHYP